MTLVHATGCKNQDSHPMTQQEVERKLGQETSQAEGACIGSHLEDSPARRSKGLRAFTAWAYCFHNPAF